MKAHYTTHGGKLRFELEGETVKALFTQFAAVQEVFDSEHVCGLCGSLNIRYLARKVDDFDFYELACQDCRARFAFGQAKKGGALFPKRKDEDGNYLPNGGWSKYEAPNGNGSHEHHSAPAQKQPPPAQKQANGRQPAAQASKPGSGVVQPREIPAELIPFFARVQKKAAEFPRVCTHLLEMMEIRDGLNGGAAYNSVLNMVDRKFPDGMTRVNDMREVLIDLWEAYETLAPDSPHRLGV